MSVQRDHQHNAVVYKTVYAANPFDNMTEEEITKYKEDIEGKKAGEHPASLYNCVVTNHGSVQCKF